MQGAEKGGMNLAGHRGFATAWATWTESLCDATSDLKKGKTESMHMYIYCFDSWLSRIKTASNF